MNTKQIILNKLKNARKESLSKKVDLSLVDDLDRAYTDFLLSYNDALFSNPFFDEMLDKISDFQTELSIEVDNFVINGYVRNLEEDKEEMENLLSNVEEASNQLGINPSEIFDRYEDARAEVNESEGLFEEFTSQYREVIKASNNGLADFS